MNGPFYLGIKFEVEGTLDKRVEVLQKHHKHYQGKWKNKRKQRNTLSIFKKPTQF